MSALLLSLLLGQAAPQDPLRDWSYQRKEVNPRTGREEVTAIIGGAEALPVSLAPGREVLEVRKVKARYFTEPRSPEDKSVEVRIEAEKGRMDNGARTLRIEDGVRVLRAADGALLEASEAVVHFPLRYVCVACDPRREATATCPGCAAALKERALKCPGCEFDLKAKPPRCPACGAALRDRSFPSVEVPGTFSFAGPEGVLRGEGLSTDDALRATRVARNGYFEIVGNPADLARAPGARGAPRRAVSQLACRGPLTIAESEADGRTRVRALEAVRLDRIDEAGTSTAKADELELAVVRAPLGPQVREIRARGRVELDTVSFADGLGVTARGDALDWDHVDLTFWSEDLVRMEGAPAQARIGPNDVRSRTLRLQGPEGLATFEGEVRADLDAAGRRVALASDRLEAKAAARAPAGWELREVEAAGRVVLTGLLPAEGDAGGRAEAERFRWNLAEQRGLLESPRFVRLVQGTSTVRAPRVVVENAGATVVLKGPKEIVFRPPAQEGRPPEEIRASCEGDAVLRSASGRIAMAGGCSIRTGEFRMTCDRVDALLGKGGEGLQSLRAAGRVRADRPGDGVVLYGDRMTYDPSKRELELFGSPFAVAEGSRMTSVQERLVFYERPNGKPGGTIRYMEMRRGSGAGIRITLTAGGMK
jgi:hypothetical protein